MPLTENQKQARYNYAKKALKRIPLDVQKEKYAEIQVAAQNSGESVNGYIKKAIDERMERDGFTSSPEETTHNQSVPQTGPQNTGLQLPDTRGLRTH